MSVIVTKPPFTRGYTDTVFLDTLLFCMNAERGADDLCTEFITLACFLIGI